jgi:RNA polymerase sigma-70 factor (ECF subfamily)
MTAIDQRTERSACHPELSDAGAIASLVVEHRETMLRVARCYVGDRATAEDVVQETWIAARRGVDRFDGRSSMKTWLFRILVNRAKTTGVRQSRVVPMASVPGGDRDGERTASPARLPERSAIRRVAAAATWEPTIEDRLELAEDAATALAAIAGLPHHQRAVITLRDVRAWNAREVCALMGISEGNQRVLLHRARGGVRRALHSEAGAGTGR